MNLFWHYAHYGNQGGDPSKFPVPDPRYDAAKEQARRHQLEHELMPELEARHAAYLDPDWQPNADWWGSQIVAD